MRERSLAMKRGLRLLSNHDAISAIKELRIAVELCPPSRPTELAKSLLFLGTALARSGQTDLAIRSWVAARRVRQSGIVVKLYDRWINAYGMRRRGSEAEDDYAAFKAIQISRYLCSRPAGRFGSQAEFDMVVDHIQAAWRAVSHSGFLKGLRPDRKLAFFRRARVVLPLVRSEYGESDSKVIIMNFRHGPHYGMRLGDDSSCACGSGLSRIRCCARLEPYRRSTVESL